VDPSNGAAFGEGCAAYPAEPRIGRSRLGVEPLASPSGFGPAGARSGNPPLSPWRVGNVLEAAFEVSAAGRAVLPSQLFSAGPVSPGRPEVSGTSVRAAPGTRTFCSPNAEKVDWSAAAAEAPGVRVGRPLLVVGGGKAGESPAGGGNPGVAEEGGGNPGVAEEGGGNPGASEAEGGGKPGAPEGDGGGNPGASDEGAGGANGLAPGTDADARPGGVNPARPNGDSGEAGSAAGAGGAHADGGCCCSKGEAACCSNGDGEEGEDPYVEPGDTDPYGEASGATDPYGEASSGCGTRAEPYGVPVGLEPEPKVETAGTTKGDPPPGAICGGGPYDVGVPSVGVGAGADARPEIR
jgi:hypothetical protein